MVRIEAGGIDRLTEIVQVNEGIFKNLYPCEPFSLEQYRQKIGERPNIMIATHRGRIVGNSIGFARKDAWYTWILGVVPEFRERGIGKRLLQSQEAYAFWSGYRLATIKVYNVSKEMQQLVRDHGYKAAGMEKSRDHPSPEFDAVRFERPLYLAVKRKPKSPV